MYVAIYQKMFYNILCDIVIFIIPHRVILLKKLLLLCTYFDLTRIKMNNFFFISYLLVFIMTFFVTFDNTLAIVTNGRKHIFVFTNKDLHFKL